MRDFAQLIRELDRTNKTNQRLAALVRFFDVADDRDAIWAVALLSGRRPRRPISASQLREWAAEAAGLPQWLFAASYDVVGDLAETVALCLPAPSEGHGEQHEARSLADWMEEVLIPLRTRDEDDKREAVLRAWRTLSEQERFVFNKLLTGGFRVGVSRKMVTRALSQVFGIDANVLAHRLMGKWEITAEFYRSIRDPDTRDAAGGQPYPFLLAHPLEVEPADLGSPRDFVVEWKWDGIRAQVIRRSGQTWIWTRGEELVTDAFPELAEAAADLPDGTVLDGEVVAFREHILPFSELQRRLNRKKVGTKLLRDVPLAFIAWDILEHRGLDLRDRPLQARRLALEETLGGLEGRLLISEPHRAATWQDFAALRAQSRAHRAEGLMLKARDSAYGVGRVRGSWWKWKLDPMSVDAVLMYAQRGHGRRSNLYTDYTFGVWHEGELVPFAKAYSGLRDEEFRAVDRFVKQHTRERFGPVRSVTPELVFELHFEGIRSSRRHKSGLALRFPRMARWRRDKRPEDADHLSTLQALLRQLEGEDDGS
jgi:DNA ligase-1